MENNFVALLEMAQEAFMDAGLELTWDEDSIELIDEEGDEDDISMSMHKFRSNIEDHYGELLPIHIVEGDAFDAFAWAQIGLIGEVIYG